MTKFRKEKISNENCHFERREKSYIFIPNKSFMDIPKGKKIYFSSDNHLGAPTMEESREREAVFVKWLNEIKEDAAAIFLLGDLFRFLVRV